MKNFILLIALCLFTTMVSGQIITPFYQLTSQGNDAGATFDGKAAASGISFYNSWINGSTFYNFSEKEIELGGNLMYVAAYGDKWSLPITGNIKTSNLDSIARLGAKIGIDPYYIINSNGQAALVAFSSINYQIQPEGTPNQFGFLAGLEASFKPRDEGNAISLSIAPEFRMNAANAGNQQWGLGVTNILPIDGGFGFVTQAFLPFRNGTKAMFSMGLVVIGPIGN